MKQQMSNTFASHESASVRAKFITYQTLTMRLKEITGRRIIGLDTRHLSCLH